ncbi:MAG: DUF1653 domain-containing protein [Burkholderiales bacterium]|jgi:hypothetical protein|nr:MAG: DUF1653 domain-containing protein [Burkholderiales bacterium]
MDTSRPVPALPQIELGVYRHYKGPLYDVMGVVRHSETLEALVLYRPQIGDGTVWVRPWAMFFEQVETDGQQRPRFERLP